MKDVIINADDFGLSRGTNLGIIEAHTKGILTSTSLFATTPGYAHAISLVKKHRSLGVGVHLSLTWGKSVAPPNKVSHLVDKDGYFKPSYLRLIIKSLTSKEFLQQVKIEFESQINKILKSGLTIDHLDSQQHVHMIPTIYKIVYALSNKYKIRHLRFSNERFFLVTTFPEIINPFINSNFLKFLLMKTFSLFNKRKQEVSFYGLMYTTKTNQKVLNKVFKLANPGVTEILSHPAHYKLSTTDKPFDFKKQAAIPFMKSKDRAEELKALTISKTKEQLSQNELNLTNYTKLISFK